MSREAALAIATGQPATVEIPQSPGLQAVPDQVVTEESPKELESTRFSHLAKKEAELQRHREELKKERDQVLADKEKIKPIHEKLLKFEDLKKTDPVAAIRFLEFSDTDFINYLAAQEDKSTPEERAIKATQAEIKKFQDAQAEKETKAQEEQNKRVLDRFKQDITKHISTDKDAYEYCNFHGSLAEDLIYETVAKVLEDSKEIISVKEAADLVESYYEEQDKMMNSLKKRAPKEIPQEVKAEEPLRAQVAPRPSTPSKTLTAKATATIASTVTRKETPSEKRERLIRKLGGL